MWECLYCCLLLLCVVLLLNSMLYSVPTATKWRTWIRTRNFYNTHIDNNKCTDTSKAYISCGRKIKTKRSLKFTKTKTLYKAPEYQINFIHFALITVMGFSFFIYFIFYDATTLQLVCECSILMTNGLQYTPVFVLHNLQIIITFFLRDLFISFLLITLSYCMLVS